MMLWVPSKRPEGTLARPLTVALLCCVGLVYAASFSSGVFNEFLYNYEVSLNNGPSGFRFRAKASLEVLYAAKSLTSARLTSKEIEATAGQQPTDSLLVRLRLSDPVFFAGPTDERPEPLQIDAKYNKLYQPDHDLYAHIVTLSNGTAIVKELYTHQADAVTFKNIKKSILLNILPTNHHLSTQQQQSATSHSITVKPLCTHDNNAEQPELFSPDTISQVNIVAKARKSKPELTTISNGAVQINLPTLFQTVQGYQNVTFGSRLMAQAQSNLTTQFSLELVDQVKSNAHEQFDQAESIDGAIQLLDKKKYQVDNVDLERERPVCSTHHCGKTLGRFFQDYRDYMTDESMASVEAAVAFLRLLDRLRDSQGSGVNDILAILKAAKGNQGVVSSILDVLVAARTQDSILAAFKYVKLAKSQNLDVAERFLSSLSVAVKTASKMRLQRPILSPYYFSTSPALRRSKEAKAKRSRLASLEFIAKEFLNIYQQTPAGKWAAHKLRWSSMLTLATLVNANNYESNNNNNNDMMDDELTLKMEKLLLRELEACDRDDTDCRIVALLAMGNLGRLGDQQFKAIKHQVLQFGRRESNAAMKVLRDLLQNQPKGRALDQGFFSHLKKFLLQVVYDSSCETTSRVLAAEMIARFLPDGLASEDLLMNLPSFGNNELATMIYSRMQSLRPDSLPRHHENWHWKSCIINGSSTSFVKTMARTDSLNASYGVNVELLTKGVFKESSFDVFLDTKQRTQDLFSLGIFARGLARFADGAGDDDDDEATMAGMSLKLLGGSLRPYVFFTGVKQAMSLIWHRTASEPTTAFNGNLLLIDHEEGYPLISGFVAEQQMRGVLSIDVFGHIQVSWFWNKNSHSVVTTKAAVIVQAQQSVFTSMDNFWHSHLFSFGGQAMIDFVADAHFGSMPVRTCLQVTQPEFVIRHNSRRHEQMMTAQARKRVTRREFLIGSKSYSLNSENNKMCAALTEEL